MDLLQNSGVFLNSLLQTSLLAGAVALLLLLVERIFLRDFNANMMYALWLLIIVRSLFINRSLVQYEPDVPQNIMTAILAVWLLGSVFAFLRQAIRYFRIRRRIIENEVSLPEWLHGIFLDVRQSSGVRVRPVLMVTAEELEPLLIGTFRPVIVLSRNLVREENASHLTQVLRHELCHLKRRDLWFGWLVTFATSLHWFNPLIKNCARKTGEYRELACDRSAVKSVPESEKFAYGKALLYMAGLALAECPAGAACIVEGKKSLERRIEMITRASMSGIMHRLFSVAGSALFVMLLIVSSSQFAMAKEWWDLPEQKLVLMGRVDNFCMNNWRDFTSRKSLEWGEVEETPDGNLSITYKFRAIVWEGKDTLICGKVFTFSPEGKFVSVTDLPGYPQSVLENTDLTGKPLDDENTIKVMHARVEKFFSENFKDIASRETVEWGQVKKDDEGNLTMEYEGNIVTKSNSRLVVRYKFTYTAKGRFVSAKKVPGFPKKAEDDPNVARAKELIKEMSNPDAPQFQALNDIIGMGEDAVPTLLAELPGNNNWQLAKALGAIGTKKAVKPLIDKLEKPPFSPMDKVVAEALEKITGENFGTDAKRWQKWYSSKGKKAKKDTSKNNEFPKIVKLIPENFAENVDTGLSKLTVVFDRDMNTKGYSWCGGGETYPKTTGKPKWTDKRTCILPVKLEAGKRYRLGINAPRFLGFRSAEGDPVKPVMYYFTTAK